MHCLTGKGRLFMGVLLSALNTIHSWWCRGKAWRARKELLHVYTWVAYVAWLEIVQGLCSSLEDVYIEDSTSFIICQNSIGSVWLTWESQIQKHVIGAVVFSARAWVSLRGIVDSHSLFIAGSGKCDSRHYLCHYTTPSYTFPFSTDANDAGGSSPSLFTCINFNWLEVFPTD